MNRRAVPFIALAGTAPAMIMPLQAVHAPIWTIAIPMAITGFSVVMLFAMRRCGVAKG